MLIISHLLTLTLVYRYLPSRPASIHSIPTKTIHLYALVSITIKKVKERTEYGSGPLKKKKKKKKKKKETTPKKKKKKKKKWPMKNLINGSQKFLIIGSNHFFHRPAQLTAHSPTLFMGVPLSAVIQLYCLLQVQSNKCNAYLQWFIVTSTLLQCSNTRIPA